MSAKKELNTGETNDIVGSEVDAAGNSDESFEENLVSKPKEQCVIYIQKITR